MMTKKSRKRARLSVKLPMAVIISLFLGYAVGQEVNSKTAPLPAISIAENAIQVRFSPGGQCLHFAQQAIASAQKTILVQAYAFTARPIAASLIAAHQRGIEVKVLADRSQRTARGSQIQYLAQNNIPVLIDAVPGIAHNKVIIIDDSYVLTGSFNWTQAAETRNAENLILIADAQVNKLYTANWQARAAQATPFIKHTRKQPQAVHQGGDSNNP
jgi:phospholipase D